MRRSGSPSAMVAVLATASLLAALLQTLVIPLIPNLPVLLNASPADTSWVVTISLLTGAIVTPVSGRLGDGFAVFTMLFVFPQILQASSTTGYGFGQSLVRTGLVVAPAGVVGLLMTPVSARLITRYGARPAMMLGAIVIAAGYVFVTLLMGSVMEFVIASGIIGTGTGISTAATSKLITDAVPMTETGSANGVNTLMRSLGSSAASAVLTVILAQVTSTVGGATFPSKEGFRTTFVVAAAGALLGLSLTALIPTRARNKTTPDPTVEPAHAG